MSIETPVAPQTDATSTAAQAIEQPPEQPVLEELLVEEVSIDGMCGVY